MMNTQRNILSCAMSALLFGLGSTATADPDQVEKLVSSINSVTAAKAALKSAFEELDACQVGSCFNENSIYVCEIVGTLDLKLNGQIINRLVPHANSLILGYFEVPKPGSKSQKLVNE